MKNKTAPAVSSPANGFNRRAFLASATTAGAALAAAKAEAGVSRTMALGTVWLSLANSLIGESRFTLSVVVCGAGGGGGGGGGGARAGGGGGVGTHRATLGGRAVGRRAGYAPRSLLARASMTLTIVKMRFMRPS